MYAEDLNYWKTSKSSPDAWVDKAIKEIKKAGGVVTQDGYANDRSRGKSGYLIAFSLDSEMYRLFWPVLESKTGDHKAAKVQAATMLYHDVKSRCVASKVLGAKAAFLTFLVLPSGMSAFEATNDELALQIGFNAPKMLESGE